MSNNAFKNFSRRDMLKAFGVAGAGFAFPFLKSEVAMGQTTVAPVRLLVLPANFGWGTNPEMGVGAITGTSETNFTLPRHLQALNAIKNQCVFVDGIRTTFWGNAHDVSYADILTSSVRYSGDGALSDFGGGPFGRPTNSSIDWRIANQFGKDSLRMSWGYKSFGANHHPLSFDNSLRILSYDTSALATYTNVIDPLKIQLGNGGGSTGGGSTGGGTVPNPVGTINKALLSLTGKDASQLMARLSGTEKTKMEGYIAALAKLGSGLDTSTTMGGGSTTTPAVLASSYPLPAKPSSSIAMADELDVYFEMIKVAFCYDTHRTAVLGLGQWAEIKWNYLSGGATSSPYGTDLHEKISHWGGGPGDLNGDQRLVLEGRYNYLCQKIVTFVNSLSNITDVDGRKLIDNTIIVLTGEVGDGQHDTRAQMLTVIGGGGNKIRRGRWLNLPKVNYGNKQGIFLGSLDSSGNQVADNGWGVNTVPVGVHHAADLWVSIAQLCGLNINTFGLGVYNQTPISLA